MKVKVFASKKLSLIFALEELKNKIEKEFSSYDLLLFAVSPKYPYKDINFYINKVFPEKNYAAFHSIDSFCDDEIVEGISVAVFKFEKNGGFNLFSIEDIDDKKSLEKTVNYLNENKDKLHIIIGGLGENLGFGFFIEELSKKLNYSPVNNIIGGISSGYRQHEETLTYQFVEDKVIKNGFFILSFENVEFSIGIALGFKPYGITYKIEKADGYKIYTIDDGKNFSYVAQNFLKDIENPDIRYLWYCPIYILDDNEGYVATLRTFANVNKDYVELYAPVKNGQHFKLSFATSNELLRENEKIAYEVKEKLFYPEFIFDFSCMARQYVLEEKQKKEIEIYTSILNAHLFGFFTYGEIGPDKQFKRLKLYNETSLLLAMKEK